MEWKRRKARRASDVLALLKAGNPPNGNLFAPAGGRPTFCAEARAVDRSLVLARSSACHEANGRVYFPVDSCNLQYFESSAKRWR